MASQKNRVRKNTRKIDLEETPDRLSPFNIGFTLSVDPPTILFTFDNEIDKIEFFNACVKYGLIANVSFGSTQ